VTRVIVSVGTDHHPFERMLDWAEVAQQRLDLDVLVQRGATAGRAGLESVDYVTADELAQLMGAADAVVCHGGPGTISLAQRSGHRPIVVARDPALGEHVDDHQQRYTAKLAIDDVIDRARSVDELIELLSAPRPVSAQIGRDETTAQAVAEFAALVEQLLDGTLPKRKWRDRIVVRRTR
jgi:UDP-N-acetylglucosamine transferase subunit ALG13